MGWNAGGFGRMTFPSPGALAAWHASTVHHDAWSDWKDFFTRDDAEDFVVDEQLALLRRLHEPDKAMYLAFDESDDAVEFTLETGEDEFRELVGPIAALLRSAAVHGATGAFWFLGTAGAEYDFTYRVVLADGTSSLAALGRQAIADVYEGDAYQQFMNKVARAFGFIDDDEDLEHAGSIARAAKASNAAIALDSATTEAPRRRAAKKSAARKPPTMNPAASKSAATKSAAKKPAAKKPAKKSGAKKSAARSPAAKKAKKRTKSSATK